jgi:hypothetical protein
MKRTEGTWAGYGSNVQKRRAYASGQRLKAIDRGEITPADEGERIGYHIRRYHALMGLIRFIERSGGFIVVTSGEAQ